MTRERLVLLHRYNGWNLVFLILSGVLLYLPALRGPLALVRTPLKVAHIASGVLSLALLVAYLPQAREHWRKLGRRVGQKANVVWMAFLLVGWGLTGIALWWNRYMPEGWSEAALIWHDRLTWLAIPWVAAHSVTRYYRMQVARIAQPLEDRRAFVAAAGTAIFFLGWGRLGRALGLPGFEAPAASPEERTAERHEPLPPGAEFLPPPISDEPPGGGAKGRFRVYTVTREIPKFDPETWSLKVFGLVERPLTFTWPEFVELPRTEQVSHFHCVTGWSVYNCTWEGVRLSDLLAMAGLRPGASHVKFYSADGVYTDAVPLEVARMEDVMLPYRLDGSLLPTPLGGPVRLIIPQMYAYKSVKWVNAIELIAEEHVGYWEQFGYPSDAWVRKKRNMTEPGGRPNGARPDRR